ncbi:TAXI family TRAP transporter solute-binding subunit [Methylocapsa sp. D3K7]|uniref:TAXI family TRAP transporter solute-binding subunit n=1 Tax=Methylocapsa sp. D3K7 TaxID=3041435 RepID=UPI00244EB3CF|nr:TAXI family TRAP transporter solute-binding subunit [Methylocapsa sp. D3K7]WGJ14455.1 TAXI family TRAP transporter solute-binding subunit [Methylocapsa sp. D3K7]
MRRLILGTIIGSLTVAAAAATAIYYIQRPNVLRVAVPHDSDDQAIMTAAALGFAADREGIRFKLIAVDGLAESSRVLEEGRADLAIVRSDIAMPPSSQTVLIMRRNVAVLFAPAQSGLHAIDDLRGHKIGILQSGAAGKADNHFLLDTALIQYDVPPASVKRVSLSVGELARAIEHKEIDAVFAVGVPGSDGLTEAVGAVAAAGHGPPVFLPIAEAKAIAQRSPLFEEAAVMRGAFGGAQPKPSVEFDTLGVSTRLVARNSLSNETAGEVTRLMLASRPSIAARNPIANRIEAPPADKGAALPVHPGSLAFLDDEEQSFFEKYSDVFYIGAMCLSVLGTGLAAAAARLSRHNSADTDKILCRLIEITKAARTAEHVGLLDDYEEEADELLALALTPDAVHALSVNRMGALTLALNQVRHAIAERRQSLASPVRTHFAPRIVREEG